MVGIWASAFAQQVSDRLEDKKAENALKQVANDEYDAGLVELYTDQFKSNREFYLNRMAVDQAERSKLQGDTIIATNAVREVLDKTTIPQILGNEVKPLSNQEKQARVDDNEVYKFVKTLKLRNPNLRLTKDMLVPAIVKAMKVSPNLFMKSSAKSEINKAPDTTIDPEAQKNMNKMFKAEAELKSISDDESFFSMASDFLSPVWASLTNEPGRRMTQEEAKSLMIKRYGDNYSKVNKYKEEYVSGRGTQLRINPEVASGLYEEVLERGRVIEEERAAGLAAENREATNRATTRRQQTKKKNLGSNFMVNTSKKAKGIVTAKLVDMYGEYERDALGQIIFKIGRKGDLGNLDRIGRMLADKAGEEVQARADELRESRSGDTWTYNESNNQAELDLQRDALEGVKAIGVVKKFQGEIEKLQNQRGAGAEIPAAAQVKILRRLWKEAYGSTLKASSKADGNSSGGSTTVNAQLVAKYVSQGTNIEVTDAIASVLSGYNKGDRINVELTNNGGDFKITKVK